MDIKNVNNLTNLRPALTSEAPAAQQSHPDLAGNTRRTIGSPATGAPAAGDRVHLTDAAARLQVLEAALASVPVVSAQRAGALHQTLAQGHFVADPQRIADKLLQIDNRLPPPGR